MLTREWIEKAGRRPGELERAYGSVFQSFVRMIADGSFPFPHLAGDSSSAPRVGDGVMWLNDDAEVQYVSPNANSALHRVGIQASAIGMRLAELGFHDGPVRQAFERQVPVIEEFEQGDGVTLLCRCVPFVHAGEVTGAVLLMRDVTELRKRDRLLLSKDATIREIHHRVKNNLQTISSLLRLQARRLTHPEAIAAVGDSVRRIRTIALVHEALSREPGDDVTFMEIVRPLLRLAEEGLQSIDRPVRFTAAGRRRTHPRRDRDAAVGGAHRAAAERRRPRVPRGQRGRLGRRAARERRRPSCGCASSTTAAAWRAGFRLEDATGLGLSIVRTLVTTELDGIDRDATAGRRRRRQGRPRRHRPRHHRRARGPPRRRLTGDRVGSSRVDTLEQCATVSATGVRDVSDTTRTAVAHWTHE